MKLMQLCKDGGSESKVWGFFLIESKSLFSVVLLHFAPGSRDAYHSHAFHAISWLVKGRKLTEHFHDGRPNVEYKPSIWPILTLRSTFHKVVSDGDCYALSFRGPWVKRWMEYIPSKDRMITLTNGRQEIV